MPNHPDGSRLPFPQVLAKASLPARSSSAAAARAAVRHALPEGLDADRAATFELLTSELVTNVIRHVGTPFRLCVSVPRPGVLRGEVHDDDSGELPPNPGLPAASSEQGRGLALVEALAAAWGVTTESGGKTIWFDVV